MHTKFTCGTSLNMQLEHQDGYNFILQGPLYLSIVFTVVGVVSTGACCTNPGHLAVLATKFCTMAHICSTVTQKCVSVYMH
jgi:hypothetical protein